MGILPRGNLFRPDAARLQGGDCLHCRPGSKELLLIPALPGKLFGLNDLEELLM
jgi:hypothetical protein